LPGLWLWLCAASAVGRWGMWVATAVAVCSPCRVGLTRFLRGRRRLTAGPDLLGVLASQPALSTTQWSCGKLSGQVHAESGVPWSMYNQCILAGSFSSGVSAGLLISLPLQLGNTVLGVTSVLCWMFAPRTSTRRTTHAAWVGKMCGVPLASWIDKIAFSCSPAQFAGAWQALGNSVCADWPLSFSVAALLDSQQLSCYDSVPVGATTAMAACTHMRAARPVLPKWPCSTSQLEAADECSCTLTTGCCQCRLPYGLQAERSSTN